MITFALGIPHTPWKAERVKSLERLERDLGLRHTDDITGGDYLIPGRRSHPHVRSVRYLQERCPNWQWSGDMWKWASETDSSHFVSLQDDVIVSGMNFWPELRAMVEAFPRDVIGLESVHPQCVEASKRGDRMITTSEGLIGVGYVVPRSTLLDFLSWRGSLGKGAIESINEDTLLCVWCLVSGHRVHHPVPTIIDHDTSLPSTYKNDTHSHRKPLVTWRDVTPGTTRTWWSAGKVEHAGHFYGGEIARLARRWVPGATDEDWEHWREA